MSSLLKVSGTVATKKIFAILFALIALHVTMLETHAAPALDSSFGSSGIARIGVPAGAEDMPTTSALQRDGKLLLAGWTAGRQSHAFVLRLLPNGIPDATFGENGVALFDLPNQYYYDVQQLEQGADGSILIKVSNSIMMTEQGETGYSLTRLTAAGILDTSFGTQGFFSVGLNLVPFVQQPDGGLLIVSDASQGGQFALRLTRLNSAGVRDSTYAPNGEKILSDVPQNFRLSSVVAEPNGGFTVMASEFSSSGSSYLLVRVTAAGTLNLGFGNGGLVSGSDAGNTIDQPDTMVRTANGGLLLMGKSPTLGNGRNRGNDKTILWRVTAGGLADTSLGTAGRLEIDRGYYSYGFQLAALSDDSIALVNAVDGVHGSTAHVRRFDVSGVLASSTTIALAGYDVFTAIGILPNGTGGLLIPAAASRTVTCIPFYPTNCFNVGADAVVASLDGSGRLQTSYGRGDGFAVAVVNTAEYYSNDKVVEFYNTNLDNYFITADANEAAGIDGGSAGPGWIRTGNSFKSGGSTPVCRFYGSQVPGPNVRC
ncbi:MAG: hypothetical protein Q8K74_00970 [Candidatus Nitrotoga sp.]|nr:hypothetical protein [Candidatus Nitrotoga sp.]